MRHSLAILLLAAAAAVPAQAHNQWIKPSATSVSGTDGWVTFDAATSTDPFVADHNAMRLESIRAFAPDGSEVKIENGAAGRYRSTFDLHLTQPGTYRVGTANSGVMGSYKLDGEDRRVGGRGGPPPGAGGPGGPGGMAPRPGAGGPPPESGGPDFKLPPGATDVKLTERIARNEVFVTLGKPSPIKPSGKGLELAPITHPADLVSDEPARFRLLVDGKPAANVKVELIPDGRRYRDAAEEIALTSDAKGEVVVRWPAPGLYWLSASATDKKTSVTGVGERRLGYATTLEVLAP